jgi:hypothetical protein
MTEEKEHTEELEDNFRELIAKELSASEMVIDIKENNSVDEINSAATEVVNDIIENIEDDGREKRLYMLLVNLGETLGSPSMAEQGKNLLREKVK